MSLKDTIANTEEVLQKGITTATISRTDNTDTLQPAQDLTPFITDVSIRPTPFVDKFLPRAQRGIGSALSFNQKVAKNSVVANARDAVYADGTLPADITPVYAQTTIPFVSMGYSSSVSGLAQAQGQAILDLETDAVENTMSYLKEALEWMAFYGSTTTLNTASLPQFAGLNELITTNVINAGGAKLSGVTGKAIMDEAAQRIAYNGGVATHVFCDINSGINLNNTYSGVERVIMTDIGNGSITQGEMVAKIRTVAGTWDYVPSFMLNPGSVFKLPNGSSSAPIGATTSTAFVVNERFINFVNLLPMTLDRLGKRTDKNEFFVRIYTALKNEAEVWCAKITNIDSTI